MHTYVHICMKVNSGNQAPGLKMLFYPLYIANKTECFSYNDGHVIWIAKLLTKTGSSNIF